MGTRRMKTPIKVLNLNVKREEGKKARYGIIAASKAVADIVRTTLGPSSMLKMLLDIQGGITLTNDGNAILREIDVSHPAAKSIVSLARTQDENVGDGTTSVVILAGELMHVSEPFLEKNLHPTVISKAYNRALEHIMDIINEMSFPIDLNNRANILQVINSSVSTKFTYRLSNIIAELALEAVNVVVITHKDSHKEVDTKKYIKFEKIPGGDIEDSRVLKGVMFNKDVINPGRMKRKIFNPKVLLLDCSLEYKKGENMINVEMLNENDFATLLRIEEESIKKTCAQILSVNPDLVITEKGVSDLATFYLQKAGVSVIRRIRKTDNNRIARACGATIIHRPEEINGSHVGTGAGLFEVKKIGEEFFSFLIDCKNPKACSVILRGASKDFLNEVERNLHDAIDVTRNIHLYPYLLPGGGASEMEISKRLAENSQKIKGPEKLPYFAVCLAIEVIPRTLAQNCGVNVIRSITKLRAKHTESKGYTWGINGHTGLITDMKELGVWEPFSVKAQTLKTALESVSLLVRIDDFVSGIGKRNKESAGQPKSTYHENQELD